MARTRQVVTLGDLVQPRSSTLAWQAVVVLACGALMGLFAQIAIPLPLVPITGQTFGVLLFGVLLGRRRGALAMLAYLGEGLVGLPVFANATSAWSPSALGVPVILGPTAGYLLAFPVAAYVVGALAERGWDRTFWSAAVAMGLGSLVIYTFGVSWLAHALGWKLAFVYGVLPFWGGDLLKLLLAASLLPLGWRVLRALAPEMVGAPLGRRQSPAPRP